MRDIDRHPNLRRALLVFAGSAFIAELLVKATGGPRRSAAPDEPGCPDDSNCPLPLRIRRPRLDDLPAGTGVGLDIPLPPELRTRNWGGGSCVHASNVNILKQQDEPELAEWWRKTYSGGEYDDRLVKRLEAAGLRYAYTHGGRDSDGDGIDDGEAFLEWCHRTRRWAGIFYKPAHSINFIGFDGDYACLLDNNDVNYPEREGHPERVVKAEFYRRWRGFGAFAWTLVGQPMPGTPHLENS